MNQSFPREALNNMNITKKVAREKCGKLSLLV